LFQGHWLTVLRIAVCATFAMVNTIVNVFALGYATGVEGISRPTMLGVIAMANAAAVISQPFFGILADRVGRKPVFFGGLIGVGVMIFVFFHAIGTHNVPWIYLSAVLLIGICYAAPKRHLPGLLPGAVPGPGALLRHGDRPDGGSAGGRVHSSGGDRVDRGRSFKLVASGLAVRRVRPGLGRRRADRSGDLPHPDRGVRRPPVRRPHKPG
jgi:MFS family permease